MAYDIFLFIIEDYVSKIDMKNKNGVWKFIHKMYMVNSEWISSIPIILTKQVIKIKIVDKLYDKPIRQDIQNGTEGT